MLHLAHVFSSWLTPRACKCSWSFCLCDKYSQQTQNDPAFHKARSLNLKRHEPSTTHVCCLFKCFNTMLSKVKTVSYLSITQAAAVLTSTYTIVEDNWETTFTPSDRHHLLNVKLKHTKSLNGSIIETSFVPNSQWTCTGTMAKGDNWTINNFNAASDDRRAAMVSLSPVPQNFASDNIEVRNSMSSDVARFLCIFSKI